MKTVSVTLLFGILTQLKFLRADFGLGTFNLSWRACKAGSKIGNPGTPGGGGAPGGRGTPRGGGGGGGKSKPGGGGGGGRSKPGSISLSGGGGENITSVGTATVPPTPPLANCSFRTAICSLKFSIFSLWIFCWEASSNSFSYLCFSLFFSFMVAAWAFFSFCNSISSLSNLSRIFSNSALSSVAFNKSSSCKFWSNNFRQLIFFRR